ncbi:hypothetical protein BH11PSE7_BH11PSE7_08620 [soil metagenome]
MSSSLIITLEISGVLGAVLIWGGWELWSLRRDRKRTKRAGNEKPPAP